MESKNQPLIDSKYQLCGSNQIASLLCSTEKCMKMALICSNEECTCVHPQCSSKTKIEQIFHKIQNERKQIPSNVQELFDEIIISFDNLIEKLSQSRVEFIQSTNMFGLSKSMLKFIKFIQEGRFEQISGNLVYEVNKELMKQHQKEISQIYQIDFQLLRDYEIDIQILSNKLDFQLSSYLLKLKKSAYKYDNKMEAQFLQIGSKFWEYIPIQIVSFNNLTSLHLSRQQIRKITNLQTLYNLRDLRLTFNRIRKIENLDKLKSLRQLYLCNNQIEKIENLNELVDLQVLGLANNRIMVLQNISCLKFLREILLMRNPLLKNKNEMNKITVYQKQRQIYFKI